MTYKEFVQKLEQEKKSNSFLFVGEEDYLIDDCVNRLVKMFVEPSSKDFNFDVFYASQVEVGRIIETANAYPMLSGTRVVIVKEFDKIATAGVEALAGYLQNPLKVTKLILICDKLNTRTKAITTIKSKSCCVECKSIYDNQIPGWIKDFVKSRGFDISYDASLLIHAHVGNNLRAIVNEVDKISLNITEKKTIEESDVQWAVGLSRKFSVFDLNDAIGNRKIENALVILTRMLESGESQTGILTMVTRHFVNLLKVKSLSAQKKSQNEIAVATGIPPFFINKNKEMSSKFTMEQFDYIFDTLLKTDLKLKTSQQSPKIALQTMLIS